MRTNIHIVNTTNKHNKCLYGLNMYFNDIM